jgi:hypothetical protein
MQHIIALHSVPFTHLKRREKKEEWRAKLLQPAPSPCHCFRTNSAEEKEEKGLNSDYFN